MEQGYAFKPSAPAPLSAAPPSEYPREGFGTRSSVDLASAARAGLRMEAGKVKSTNGHASGIGAGPPHVLFDTEDADEVEDGGAEDKSNDWGNSDEESEMKKSVTSTTQTTNNER